MKHQRTQTERRKHTPQRTCVACLTTRPKQGLVRVVNTGSGTVEVDLSGEKAGRGAYLCPARSCWETGIKRNRLSHALRTELAPENKAQLIDFSQRFSQLLSEGPDREAAGGR